jgi:hypothetical protein
MTQHVTQPALRAGWLQLVPPSDAHLLLEIVRLRVRRMECIADSITNP